MQRVTVRVPKHQLLLDAICSDNPESIQRYVRTTGAKVLLKTLLDSWRNNPRDRSLMDILLRATYKGDPLAFVVSDDEYQQYGGDGALSLAIAASQLDYVSVRELLERGCNPNGNDHRVDCVGMAPPLVACAALLFPTLGFDPTSQTVPRQTPRAVYQLEIARLLLASGANPYARSHFEWAVFAKQSPTQSLLSYLYSCSPVGCDYEYHFELYALVRSHATRWTATKRQFQRFPAQFRARICAFMCANLRLRNERRPFLPKDMLNKILPLLLAADDDIQCTSNLAQRLPPKMQQYLDPHVQTLVHVGYVQRGYPTLDAALAEAHATYQRIRQFALERLPPVLGLLSIRDRNGQPSKTYKLYNTPGYPLEYHVYAWLLAETKTCFALLTPPREHFGCNSVCTLTYYPDRGYWELINTGEFQIDICRANSSVSDPDLEITLLADDWPENVATFRLPGTGFVLTLSSYIQGKSAKQ